MAACNTPGKNTRPSAPVANQYFDVAGFVQKQITLLQQEKPTAVKSVLENGRPVENKTLTTLNWQKELESFSELDINKPAFRNAYATEKTDSAGFVTETYRLKPDAEGDVVWLSVTKDKGGQVLAIKALHQNKNVLINTRQEMQLTCHTKSGQSRVQSYQIRGGQDPILFDSLQYVLFTQIR